MRLTADQDRAIMLSCTACEDVILGAIQMTAPDLSARSNGIAPIVFSSPLADGELEILGMPDICINCQETSPIFGISILLPTTAEALERLLNNPEIQALFTEPLRDEGLTEDI